MATLKYEITYEDGKVETVKVKPRHLIAYEDAVGNVSEIEETGMNSRAAFKLPFIAATNADEFAETDYKAWLKKVDEIEALGQEQPEAAPSVDGEDSAPVPTE